MTTATATLVNGVNVEQLVGTINAIKADPAIARFKFRAETEWVDGGHSRTTIQSFYGAKQEDISRSRAFVLEGDEPPVLLGHNAVEAVLHALASCLSVGFIYNAAAQGIRVESLSFRLEGDIDLHGFLGLSDKVRAATEGLTVRFDEGDAEMLSYNDASFDVVVSLIGAMFAPRPERVAVELVRVCRSGGRIVMANWTPTGFIGQMFKVNGKHVPPPTIMPSPVLWGDEATVRERFNAAGSIAKLEVTHWLYPFKYPFGVAEVVEYFRTYYGPTQRAFAALDDSGQAALRRDLEQLWRDHNRSASGITQVESEYLEIVAMRQ